MTSYEDYLQSKLANVDISSPPIRFTDLSYIKPINMTTTEKKEPRTRTPRNYDNILKGALILTLADKVNLVKELKKSIQTEVDLANKVATEAAGLVNGL